MYNCTNIPLKKETPNRNLIFTFESDHCFQVSHGCLKSLHLMCRFHDGVVVDTFLCGVSDWVVYQFAL